MRKKSSKGGGVSIENIVEDEVDDEEVLEEDDPEVVEFMKTRSQLNQLFSVSILRKSKKKLKTKSALKNVDEKFTIGCLFTNS